MPAGAVGQDDGELLAAHARHQVHGAHAVHQRMRHGAEHQVASSVAVGIVDALEVVDVQRQQQRRFARTRHAVDLACQRQLEVRGGWPGRSGRRGWRARPARRSGPAARQAMRVHAGRHRMPGLPQQLQRLSSNCRCGGGKRGWDKALSSGSGRSRVSLAGPQRPLHEMAGEARLISASWRCGATGQQRGHRWPRSLARRPCQRRESATHVSPARMRRSYAHRPSRSSARRGRLRPRARKLIYASAPASSLHEGKHAMVYSRLSRRLRDTRYTSFAAYLD